MLKNVFLSNDLNSLNFPDICTRIMNLCYQFLGRNKVRMSFVNDSTMIPKYILGNNRVQYPVYIHTYIIGHYNPSVRIIDLVSQTTFIVCANF